MAQYGYLNKSRIFRSGDDWVQIDAGVSFQILSMKPDQYVLWKSGVTIRVPNTDVVEEGSEAHH